MLGALWLLAGSLLGFVFVLYGVLGGLMAILSDVKSQIPYYMILASAGLLSLLATWLVPILFEPKITPAPPNSPSSPPR